MRHSLAWLCVVGSLLIAGVTQGRAPTPGTAGPVLDKATAAEVRKLQERRRDLLREALDQRVKLFQAARCTMGEVAETRKQLLAAELDLAETDAERIAVYEKELARAIAVLKMAREKVEAGRASSAAVLDAQVWALEMRIGLLKAGGKLKKAEE